MPKTNSLAHGKLIETQSLCKRPLPVIKPNKYAIDELTFINTIVAMNIIYVKYILYKHNLRVGPVTNELSIKEAVSWLKRRQK